MNGDEHIVAEYIFPHGRVLISDEAYIGATEEDLRMRREALNRCAWQIAMRHAERTNRKE